MQCTSATVDNDHVRRKTTTKLSATPSNQAGVTLFIPSDEVIEVMKGTPAPTGMVRVRWDKHENGMISLYISENDMEHLTAPA